MSSPMVPSLIVHCIREIESRGLGEVGIYRVPGSERDVRALKVRSFSFFFKEKTEVKAIFFLIELLTYLNFLSHDRRVS